MKSAVAHAIKTNHFPEATRILAMCWKRACKGLNGIHFSSDWKDSFYASYAEQCMMRGWSICYESMFGFTTTHDLCDASFTKKDLEQMVRAWYKCDHERRIEEKEEFERKHPEFASIPYATGHKDLTEYTLDEWIFDFCK